MIGSWDDFRLPNEELFEPVVRMRYGEAPDQSLYFSLPKAPEHKPLVIFFHGGGMVGGDRSCPRALFNGQYAICEPRYRLSPAVKAPAQIHDAAAAIAFATRRACELGLDTSQIFVGGMSAGAYLAAISVMNLDFLRPYGLDYRAFAGLILVSGQMTTHFCVKSDLGRGKGQFYPMIDELAPLGNLAADLPPIILITGESDCDMLARAEENAFMAASLRAIGHKNVKHYELAGHDHTGVFESSGFLILRFLAEQTAATSGARG